MFFSTFKLSLCVYLLKEERRHYVKILSKWLLCVKEVLSIIIWQVSIYKWTRLLGLTVQIVCAEN